MFGQADPRVRAAASSLVGLLWSEGTGAVGKQVNGEGQGLGLVDRPLRPQITSGKSAW